MWVHGRHLQGPDSLCDMQEAVQVDFDAPLDWSLLWLLLLRYLPSQKDCTLLFVENRKHDTSNILDNILIIPVTGTSTPSTKP